MREIKFRAFCNHSKNMLEDLVFSSAMTINEVFEENEDFVFMQYIGLKDNYGTEIHEGDIIKSLEDDGNIIGVVEYKHGAYYIKVNRVYYPFHDSILDDCKTNLLIIGNIYENPELLENIKWKR